METFIPLPLVTEEPLLNPFLLQAEPTHIFLATFHTFVQLGWEQPKVKVSKSPGPPMNKSSHSMRLKRHKTVHILLIAHRRMRRMRSGRLRGCGRLSITRILKVLKSFLLPGMLCSMGK